MFGKKIKQKVKVLLMDTDFSGHYEDKEIVEGHIMDSDGSYPISQFIPLTVSDSTLFGKKTYQLYVLKHDMIAPADNMNPPKAVLSSIYPNFKDYGISPGMYRKLTGMKILGNMIKVRKSEFSILWPFIALVIGVVAMYVLVGMGYVTVPPMNV